MSKKILSILNNGFPLHADDTARGLAMMTGIIPTPELPYVVTDNANLLEMVSAMGGFGIGVTRRRNPGWMSMQRGIQGMTQSYWGHSVILIGEEIGAEVRKRYPSLMSLKPSWRHPQIRPGHPVPMVEGIPRTPNKFEIVESQLYVTISDLRCAIDKGEQVIVFFNPAWTREQKITMAREAYSWVGEPYDVFEIGSWVIPGVPNYKALKVCSTLVQKIVSAGDPRIDDWALWHNLNPEQVAPRDTFAYGVDTKMHPIAFDCNFEDTI